MRNRSFFVNFGLFVFIYLISNHSVWAGNGPLTVITSSDPGSKAAHSFIVVKTGAMIPEGIKNNSKQNLLNLQIPFIIKVNQKLEAHIKTQWEIIIPDKNLGEIEIMTKFTGSFKRDSNRIVWTSDVLDNSTLQREQLVFRPKIKSHQPGVYKKGRGKNNVRQKYGGGTRSIHTPFLNPRLIYKVSVNLFDKSLEKKYHTVIKMDNKDLIRQEYINHYNIQRYGRGENGNLPVPKRSEITEIPGHIPHLSGNPLTESKYGLLVNDGMLQLAKKIASVYRDKIHYYNSTPFVDLNGKAHKKHDSKLWLSGGWRNPERNEWYSNALNGIHQRGGAIDIIIQDPPGHTRTAISYWILWQALEENKEQLNAFWQLETNGRPMRTDEFANDIAPKNGIPDAFDKADHLHANIKYISQ
jgi:hypothetical protein